MSWGNPQNGIDYLKAGLLSPAALVYGLASTADRLSYDLGFRTRNKLPAPVISIGNITCGGTGKTPVAIALARHLVGLGLNVGVLLRGYRRLIATDISVVSDGKGNFATVEEAGDEALAIAQAVDQAVVMAGANRYKAGLQAINRFGCNVFILDDGYQHYSLARDFDIVLIDYNDEPARDSLLPSGRLREPLASLNRASQVIITKVPTNFDPEHLENLKQLIRNHSSGTDISSCRFPAKQLSGYIGDKMQVFPLSLLNGMRVITFCGLARPQTFPEQIRELGANIVIDRIFPDHHWYSDQDLAWLQSELTGRSAQFLITTQKDLVKVHDPSLKSKILALELDTEWLTGFPEALKRFIETINQNQAASHWKQAAGTAR
ncbi:MAG: tetraacyldisaccharide 4'-kinase [Candidatus Melainabacteria bacterium]|nr:MAG: tetraacyldisaccharide 4'-kinase [Candidatus Melainabacteria bacterium]